MTAQQKFFWAWIAFIVWTLPMASLAAVTGGDVFFALWLGVPCVAVLVVAFVSLTLLFYRDAYGGRDDEEPAIRDTGEPNGY